MGVERMGAERVDVEGVRRRGIGVGQALGGKSTVRSPQSVLPFALAGARWKSLVPLISGFLLLIAVAAAAIWLLVISQRFSDSVAHTLKVRTEAYRLLTLIQDAETGQRGYLLTTDRAYLRPYDRGVAEAPDSLADLRLLTGASAVQRAAVDRLGAAMVTKLGELKSTIDMVNAGDQAGAIMRVKQNVGNSLMEQIRQDVASIQAEEERVQARQAEAARDTNILLAGSSLLGILVVFGLAGYTLVSANRSRRALVAAQTELQATNDNLEALVAERVTELKAANEEIQRFAYIVSHDLRAPLVNVMGFTSELDTVRKDIGDFLSETAEKAPELVTPAIRTAVDNDLPEALDFIRASTSKMDRLINAILKLSREGRRVLTPQPIDLAALIRSQGEVLTQQLAASDAELTIQDDLPNIVSDRLAIEQIFGNLIENAIKYLKPGRPGRISVKGQAHGAYLRYEIIDNGRGIETKDFERIFELFRRSGEQDRPGEGIGLAYVRNLARRLGGNVTVQSEFGTGSTFTVTLPAVFATKTRAK